MKKYIFMAAILLLLISGVLIYVNYKPQIEANDIIIKVDKKDFIKTSEEKVLDFFEKNKEDFETLAEYILTNEVLFTTGPDIQSEHTSALIEKITDESIKTIAKELLQKGVIKQLSSFDDGFEDANFTVDYESGVFAQGIRYVNDPQAIGNDKTKYNHVKEYKDLGNGWFYYLFHYDAIKDADVYKKIVWDSMGEMDRKSIKYDWHEAIVSLEDSDSMKSIITFNKTHVKSRFVVSVCYHNELDGLLGPIIVYFDPSTGKMIGGEPRM